MQKEIERPLGQERRAGAVRRFGVPNGGTIVTAIVTLAILGAGTFIASRPSQLRTPDLEVAMVPDQTSSATDTETAAAPSAPRPSAEVATPSIITPPTDRGDSPNVIVIRDPSAVAQNPRLAHLPDRALVEQSEAGPLPVRAADGRRPFDVYARPWSGARGARVAIVIGGLGVSQTGTQAAIARLPPEVTLAFAPQGNSIGRWMQDARRTGHEIVMQVPLEPFDFPRVNPGRNTLTVEATPAQNIANLHWALSRTTNYVGVMNYMGARISADRDAFAPIIAELGQRGLLYLDDGSSARSLAQELSLANRVPFAAADATIDEARDRASILDKLDQLERTARARGFALGTGSAFDVTVDTVASWIAEARRRGIEIVPVSALAVDPEKG